jgi:hypothetical protein
MTLIIGCADPIDLVLSEVGCNADVLEIHAFATPRLSD